MKGVIIFSDEVNKKSKMVIDNIVSKSALNNFATAFDSFSNAKIMEYDTIDNTSFPGTFGDGVYKSVEAKALAIFRYTSGTSWKYLRVAIPAPDDDVIELVEGKGYRVTKGQGDAIAAMLRTLTGKSDLEFVRGRYLSHPSKGQGY